MQSKKRALGRGLEALLPQKQEAETWQATAAIKDIPGLTRGTRAIAISEIHANPSQPREGFEPEALTKLSNSIKAKGVLQPIAVMPHKGGYMIVAGERRWRASQEAGLSEIPAIILDPLGEQDLLECGLVENLQREDLTPIEEAKAYLTLVERFELSHDEIAERVGRSRSAVANTIRLTKLPIEFQKDVEEGRLSAGHARAILSLESLRDQHVLREAILSNALSVRQAEDEALRMGEGGAKRAGSRKTPREAGSEEHDVRQLQEQLVDALACRVKIKPVNHQRGKIEIFYESLDELERILARMRVD